MIRRRKPVVILLSAEELALLAERANEHGLDRYEYAQVIFRAALGVAEDDEAERGLYHSEVKPVTAMDALIDDLLRHARRPNESGAES